MYGGMCAGFYATSLISLQRVFRDGGNEAQMSFMFNESLITRARNALANQFLKSDCEYLFFIDADIQFIAEQIQPMIDADKDIICGIYPKKEINWSEVQAAVKRDIAVDDLKHHTGSWVVNLVDYQGTVSVPQDQPLEIWAGGTGMMLIKREVFEKLGDVVPVYVNDVVDLSNTNKPREEIKEFFATSIEPETGRLLSEDYHFCYIWRKIGGKIHAAPWMKLGHVGTYIFEGELIKS
jgi:glycosyltransferase involved in cell wall biosynthesis